MDLNRQPSRCGPLGRCVGTILEVLDSTALQTIQYLVFLFAFQSLTQSFRPPAMERHFFKFISDTFIVNTFDSNHNQFDDIRRVSDIYEWINTAHATSNDAHAYPIKPPACPPLCPTHVSRARIA